MRVFKYRTFEKWAKKQAMNNDVLNTAILEVEKGLMGDKLGNGVYKKRVGLHGKGKRGSHRVIILMKVGDKAIFAHGFSKGEKSNITKKELDGFKVMAEAFLNLNDEQLNTLIINNSLVEVFQHE